MPGNDGFLKESKKPLEKMSLIELLEAQERQSKILSNKKFLQKLPDKGKKLLEAQEKLEAQIKKIREEAQLADMFANMQLSQPKIDVDKMEWTGQVALLETKEVTKISSSSKLEEDERDIVNILVTTNQTSKIIIDERTRTPSPSCGVVQDKFYQKIKEKADHINAVDKKFKPFRTLKHEKPVTKERHDNTAATPPISKHMNGAIPLHLEESLEKQFEAEEKLKELVQERTKSKFFTFMGSGRKSVLAPDTSKIHSDEENEVYDEDTQDDGKYIVVTTNEDPET